MGLLFVYQDKINKYLKELSLTLIYFYRCLNG